MTGSTPARRINLALAAVGCVAVVVVAVAAVFGDRDPGPTGDATVDTIGETIEPLPAPGRDWFAPATDGDLAYPMEVLSCAAIGAQVRVDLCGVFDGAAGRFMVVGTEAFWDTTEPDFDGIVRVPLVLTVYVLAVADAVTAAVPTLTGTVAVPYGSAFDEIGLYRAARVDNTADDTVAVVIWTSRPTLRDEATEQIQLISWSNARPEARSAIEVAADPELLNSYAFPRRRNSGGP